MAVLAECDPTYEVKYGIRGSLATAATAPITALTYERLIDEVSRGTITHAITSDECCAELARLEPWADTVTIFRNGEPVWMGWLQQVRYQRNFVEVRAADALIWLRKRILKRDYDQKVDQAYHFENFWNLSMLYSPLPVEIIPLETGVVDKRASKFNQIRLGWSAVQEMFDSALDVTVLGQKIYAGKLIFPGVINLQLTDFEGDVALIKDGDGFYNAAWSDASGSIVGHYPNNVTFAGDGIYPLVEAVLRDGMLKDQASANASAKAKVDYSGGRVPRLIETGSEMPLSGNAPVSIRQLIPGRFVNLDSTGLCYAQTEQYRLNKVSVRVTGSDERVSINLEPKGGPNREETNEDAPFGVGDL